MELSNPWMLAIYVIAMFATTWHFAYGIWLFAAKWGITPGDKARRRFGWACGLFGTAICLMGLASIYAFVGPMYPNAPADVMPAQPPGVVEPAASPPGSTSTSAPADSGSSAATPGIAQLSHPRTRPGPTAELQD
jgi:succinate dehydrogenase / fumarate reductase cytochrome b subunit